ncbi:MAG: CHAT domain-containing protein [Chloroflexota bacterium]|nr:CHAT domain-containing protein [Chloroflexota bacterium]
MISTNLGPRDDYATLQIEVSSPTVAGEPFLIKPRLPNWRSLDACTATFDLVELLSHDHDPPTYGALLGKALFADDALGPAYREIIAAVRSRGDGLRVRLVNNADELAELRWERLYHPFDGQWLPLGSTASTPFSRYVDTKQWDRPLPPTQRPLRLLAVISSPQDLGTYQLDPIEIEERQFLINFMQALPQADVRILESGTANPPTLNEIRKALTDGVHMVHFLCHGAVTDLGSVLFLEDDTGNTAVVTSDRLVNAFKAVDVPPVLCFLAACETAERSANSALVPLGPALVADGGAHAVVAMADKVGVKTAQLFSQQFFARLLNHGVVDLAVNEARALVQDQWDWGVPVLFSRLPDNQLLDFPIGSFYDNYLNHADRAYLAADQALAAARLEDHGFDLIEDLEGLIKELSKSHGVLVAVSDKFRRTGANPATFAEKFEDFYFDFKLYYDNEAWVEEEASCREIDRLGHLIMPRLRPLLDNATFDALGQELALLGDADRVLLRFFSEYLDEMNEAVESIYTHVVDGEIDLAIQEKRDFEAQITPSFRRSKQMFGRMNDSVTAAMAA